jgi:hypothetical protein
VSRQLVARGLTVEQLSTAVMDDATHLPDESLRMQHLPLRTILQLRFDERGHRDRCASICEWFQARMIGLLSAAMCPPG